jgi:linoleoyl-CoA desaturase
VQLEISQVDDTPKSDTLRFVPPRQDPFTAELLDKTRAYFTQKGLSQHANAFMWFKSLFYLTGFFGTFAIILAHPSSGFVVAGLWALMGYFKVGIGFNIGHDALHGAYSANPTVNWLMGHSFSLLGAHGYTWKILHNRIHHSYTNIVGADGDLHGISWLRFFKSDVGLKPYHRFQYLYAPLLYSLTSLVWVFRKDFQHIGKRRHMIYDKPELPPFEMTKLWAVKVGYLATILGLPMLVGGYTFLQTIGGFVLMHLVTGLVLALVFQLGHIVEIATFRQLDKDRAALPSWHRMQLEGSSNFCTNNPLVDWVCGGLNFQIEHHLFPHVCHVHYPALSKIVKATAEKHGLRYNNFPTLTSALASHFRTLKANGSPRLASSH